MLAQENRGKLKHSDGYFHWGHRLWSSGPQIWVNAHLSPASHESTRFLCNSRQSRYAIPCRHFCPLHLVFLQSSVEELFQLFQQGKDRQSASHFLYARTLSLRLQKSRQARNKSDFYLRKVVSCWDYWQHKVSLLAYRILSLPDLLFWFVWWCWFLLTQREKIQHLPQLFQQDGHETLLFRAFALVWANSPYLLQRNFFGKER